MTINYYILNEDHKLVAVPLLTWGKWFESNLRRVAFDTIGDVQISTAFIGIDLSFGEHDPPLLFETMIFGGEEDGYQDRSATWDDALKQHAEAVALVKGSLS